MAEAAAKSAAAAAAAVRAAESSIQTATKALAPPAEHNNATRLPEIFKLREQVQQDRQTFREEAPLLYDEGEYIVQQLDKLSRDRDGNVGQRLLELRSFWRDLVDRETNQKVLRDMRLLLQSQTADYARQAGTSANELYRRGEMKKIRKRRHAWRDIKRTMQQLHAQNLAVRKIVTQSNQLTSATEADRKCQQAVEQDPRELRCATMNSTECAADPDCQRIGPLCAAREPMHLSERCDDFTGEVAKDDQECRQQTKKAKCRNKCEWVRVPAPFGEEAHACRSRKAEHFTWYRQHPPELVLPLEQGSAVRGYSTLEQPVAYDLTTGTAKDKEKVATKQSLGTMLTFYRLPKNAGWEEVEPDDVYRELLSAVKVENLAELQLQDKYLLDGNLQYMEDTNSKTLDAPYTGDGTDLALDSSRMVFPSDLSPTEIEKLTHQQLAEKWALRKNHVVVRIPRIDTQTPVAWKGKKGQRYHTRPEPDSVSSFACEFIQNQCISKRGIRSGTHRVDPPSLRKPDMGEVNHASTMQYLRQLYTAVPQQLNMPHAPEMGESVPQKLTPLDVKPGSPAPTIPTETGMGATEFAEWMPLYQKKKKGKKLTPEEQKVFERTETETDTSKDDLLKYLNFYAQLKGGGDNDEPEWYFEPFHQEEEDEGGSKGETRNLSSIFIPDNWSSKHLQVTLKEGNNKGNKAQIEFKQDSTTRDLYMLHPELGLYPLTRSPSELPLRTFLQDRDADTLKGYKVVMYKDKAQMASIAAVEFTPPLQPEINSKVLKYKLPIGTEHVEWYPNSQNEQFTEVPATNFEYWTADATQDHDSTAGRARLWQELFEKGQTLEFHLPSLIWSINGKDLTYKVGPDVTDSNAQVVEEYIQHMLPWKAVKLGQVKDWNVFKDNATRDCFTVGQEDKSHAAPYSKAIYFCAQGKDKKRYRWLDATTAKEKNVDTEKYDAYYMPAFDQNRETASKAAQVEASAENSAEQAVLLAELEIAAAKAAEKNNSEDTEDVFVKLDESS